MVTNCVSGVSAQLATYITLSEEFEHEQSEVLTFSSTNRSRLSKLFPLAMRVQSVTASSAPVERVFSHGGFIMHLHRSRLGDTMLSNLLFLKCNML